MLSRKILMRERRPGDWTRDLAGRHALEASMAASLVRHPQLTLLKRSTASLERLDYAIVGPGERFAQVELKAKHQSYRGWQSLRPDVLEPNLFILDELALRKIIDAGRYAYLVVADLPSRRWCVWSTLDLVLASKVRTVRDLAAGTGRQKAKLLIDLEEAAARVQHEDAAADAIARMIESCDQDWRAIEPWPHGAPVRHPFRRTS
jgi:hypothetical protein